MARPRSRRDRSRPSDSGHDTRQLDRRIRGIGCSGPTDGEAPHVPVPREMLARLVAFPSVSTSSNLDIIGFCRDWLKSHGVESRLVHEPRGRQGQSLRHHRPAGRRAGSCSPAIRTWCRWRARTGPPIPGRSRRSDGRLYGRGAGRHEGLRRPRPGAGARDGAGAAQAADPHRPLL